MQSNKRTHIWRAGMAPRVVATTTTTNALKWNCAALDSTYLAKHTIWAKLCLPTKMCSSEETQWKLMLPTFNWIFLARRELPPGSKVSFAGGDSVLGHSMQMNNLTFTWTKCESQNEWTVFGDSLACSSHVSFYWLSINVVVLRWAVWYWVF